MTVEEGQRRSSRMAWIARLPLQHVAVFFASIGDFAAGVVLGWNSFAGWMLRTSIGWEIHEAELVIGIVTAGCCFGALLCILVLTCCRRTYVLAIAYVILLGVGWFIVCRADNRYYYTTLLIGRTVCGIGVGIFTTLLPIYIGEIASGRKRDRLLYYTHAMLSCGIVASYALIDNEANDLKSYNFYCALACLPALLCGIPICINPVESMLNGKEDSARKALLFYDLTKDDMQLERDIEELRELVRIDRTMKMKSSYQFWSLLVLTICHHLSGITIVLFNGLTLIDFVGSGDVMSPSQLCLVCSVCQVIATFLGLVLVGKLGRRVLLTLSATMMAVSLGLLGWIMNAIQIGEEINPWLTPTIIIGSYYSAYGLGFGPITWAMLADSFPVKMRILGASINGAIGWLISLLLNLYCVTLLETLGVAKMLWLFVGFSLLGALLGSCLVTETRGKSLLDLQRQFLNG